MTIHDYRVMPVASTDRRDLPPGYVYCTCGAIVLTQEWHKGMTTKYVKRGKTERVEAEWWEWPVLPQNAFRQHLEAVSNG